MILFIPFVSSCSTSEIRKGLSSIAAVILVSVCLCVNTFLTNRLLSVQKLSCGSLYPVCLPEPWTTSPQAPPPPRPEDTRGLVVIGLLCCRSLSSSFHNNHIRFPFAGVDIIKYAPGRRGTASQNEPHSPPRREPGEAPGGGHFRG